MSSIAAECNKIVSSVVDDDMSGETAKENSANENSTAESTTNENEQSKICLDFVRGVCFRQNCKFLHEKDFDMVAQVKPSLYTFCKDFQVGRCRRLGCHYIHCSLQDETYYRKTGKLLPHVESAFLKIKLEEQNVIPSEICRDYKRGRCDRVRCNRLHITDMDEPFAKRSRMRGAFSFVSQNEQLVKQVARLQIEVVELKKENEKLKAELKTFKEGGQTANNGEVAAAHYPKSEPNFTEDM